MATKIHTQDELASVQRLPLAEAESIYAELRASVRDAGILDRSYAYYSVLSCAVFAGFIGSFLLVYAADSALQVCLYSAAFAFFSVQIAGLIHDAAHRAVFATPRANDIFGQFCAFFLAGCYNNWRINHNRHHAFPNQDAKDPDVEIPFSFTADRFAKLSGLLGALKKYQRFTYYPFGTLASLTMRFKRYDYFKENFGPAIYWEIALFAAGVLLRYVLPLVVLGVEKGLLFLIVSSLVEGFYMFHVFAPNHKGMVELAADVKWSFLEQQIVTSRNVRGSMLVDAVYLGLNYQIEHHLFPNTPQEQAQTPENPG